MNSVEPFGLPRGSVRAALTIMLVLLCAVMLFVRAADETVGAMFVMLTGFAVKDYFSHRGAENVAAGPPLPPPSIG